jgi:hypothetical protein
VLSKTINCDRFKLPFEPETPFNTNWDLRENETTSKKRHIILVRHGQYVFDDDDKKRVLTKIGTEQADLLGQRLAKMEANNKWDKVWISTMTRARETAAIILKRFLFSPGYYFWITISL